MCQWNEKSLYFLTLWETAVSFTRLCISVRLQGETEREREINYEKFKIRSEMSAWVSFILAEKNNWKLNTNCKRKKIQFHQPQTIQDPSWMTHLSTRIEGLSQLLMTLCTVFHRQKCTRNFWMDFRTIILSQSHP